MVDRELMWESLHTRQELGSNSVHAKISSYPSATGAHG
jgi:hypothetical protein